MLAPEWMLDQILLASVQPTAGWLAPNIRLRWTGTDLPCEEWPSPAWMRLHF